MNKDSFELRFEMASNLLPQGRLWSLAFDARNAVVGIAVVVQIQVHLVTELSQACANLV